MSKKKDENINDDIHSDSETEEFEEPNEVSEDERNMLHSVSTGQTRS